jgi:hypothetical protein
MGVSVAPRETHSKLVIDPDGVLPVPLAFKSVKLVAWGNCQIF